MGEHLEGVSGQGIKIAVVDDGVCLNSPDIKGIMGGISIQIDPSGKIVVSEDYTTDHCHSHGTACAAIIQRRAPHSELYSIRVLNPSRRCSPEALAIAIRWAATHGMHIVNLSLGTTSQETCSLLKRACREACEAGVILIGAAHPHGLVSYPSSLPEVIGVGMDRNYNECEYTYRPGKRAEFFASGEIPFETESQPHWFGTSLAAARMTGTVALILERSPEADLQEVRRVLTQNAHRDIQWDIEREQPDRCEEERYAWMGEAVLYGYDEKMRLLVQFSDLLDFKIVGVVDPFRPALSGKDAGEVAGVKPIHVRIGDSLDTIRRGDTVIVEDLREVKAQARRDDPLGEVLWWAIRNNRNVFSLSPIERALWRTPIQDITSRFAGVYTAREIRAACETISIARESKGLFLSTRLTRVRFAMDDEALEARLDSHLSYMILEVTQQCNLRCRYCTYSQDRLATRPHSSVHMSFEVAQKAINYFLLHSSLLTDRRTLVGFYGGEPLLNRSLIARCAHYIDAILGRTDTDVEYCITTNGTLLDEETIALFLKYNFLVTISLDGPHTVHDRYRVFPDGRGSYERIVRNLKRLYDASPRFYESNVSFNMCIPAPYHYLAHQKFVCSRKDIIPDHGYLQPIIPNIEGNEYFRNFSREALNPHNVEYEVFWNTYRHGAEDGILNMEDVPRYLKFPSAYFSADLLHICKLKLGTRLAGTVYARACVPGVTRIFVSANGLLFPCERCNHAAGTLCMGSVNEGIRYERVHRFISKYFELCQEDCCTCWGLRHCSLCFASIEESTGFSMARKRKACRGVRKSLHDDLVRVYSILEVNPKAFGFMNGYVDVQR